MEASVSFADPYGIYVPADQIEGLKINEGSPVQINFDSQSKNDEIIGPVKPREKFDKQKEIHALFYALPEIIENAPRRVKERFGHLLRGNHGEEIFTNSPLDVQSKGNISSYLNGIKNVNDNRIDDDSVIIGCGHLEFVSEGNREGAENEDLQTPHFELPKGLVTDLLSGDFPEIESINPYTGQQIEPSDVYFNTPGRNVPKEISNNIVQDISHEKYVMKDRKYSFRHHFINIYGPKRTDELDEDHQIISLSDETVDILSTHDSYLYSPDQVTWEELVEAIKGSFNDPNISRDGDEMVINWGDDRIEIGTENNGGKDTEESNGMSRFSFYIETPDGPNKLKKKFDRFKELINDNLDEYLFPIFFGGLSSDISEKKSWIFDTNALYRQNDGSGSDCISEFIIANYQLYDKEIVVPWQVVCEINRHKDREGQTRRASEQGVENLRILERLADYGFFDFSVEDMPNQIDNSILEKQGVSDLAILSSVPDNGVLVTGDKRLIELARLKDVPVQQVTQMAGPEKQDQYEEELQEEVYDKLDDGPMTYSKVVGFIHDSITEKRRSDIEEIDYKEYSEGLISDWYKDKEIIKYDENSSKIAKSKEVSVVPTYTLISKIANQIGDLNGQKMLSGEALEKIRKAVRGLPKSERPWVTFYIPEQYAYQADELSQVGLLYQIAEADNVIYEPVSVDSEMSTGNFELQQIAVQAARQNECILLSESNDKSVQKLGRLLGVTVRKM